MIVAFVTFLQAPGREGTGDFTPILFLLATRYSSPCARFYDPDCVETRTREIRRRDPLRKQTNRLCQSRLTMADTRNDVVSFEPRTPSRLGCCVVCVVLANSANFIKARVFRGIYLLLAYRFSRADHAMKSAIQRKGVSKQLPLGRKR